MLCKYCQIFREIKPKKCFSSKIGERYYVEKECGHSKLRVTNLSNSCNNFIPDAFFFCDDNSQRYAVKICIARQKKEACEYCTQGEMVKAVARLLGLIEPPKIIERNQNNKIIQQRKPIIQKQKLFVRRALL